MRPCDVNTSSPICRIKVLTSAGFNAPDTSKIFFGRERQNKKGVNHYEGPGDGMRAFMSNREPTHHWGGGHMTPQPENPRNMSVEAETW